jgi:hypothetical protein
MRYDLHRPCADCPFRRENGIRLSRQQAHSLLSSFVERQPVVLPCHKTTTMRSDGVPELAPDTQHCAGLFVLWQVKYKQQTAHMIAAQESGLYDPSALQGADEVVDTMTEMLQLSTADDYVPHVGSVRLPIASRALR